MARLMFSGTGNSIRLIQITYLVSGSRKVWMAVAKPEMILTCRHDSKTIPMSIFFSGTDNTILYIFAVSYIHSDKYVTGLVTIMLNFLLPLT